MDARTRDLAEAGWAEFQMIEAEGGLVEALKGSVIQPGIARARAIREAALTNGAAQIIGVTKYVDADVRPAPVEAGDEAAVAVERVCEPLAPIRFAAAFEEADQ